MNTAIGKFRIVAYMVSQCPPYEPDILIGFRKTELEAEALRHSFLEDRLYGYSGDWERQWNWISFFLDIIPVEVPEDYENNNMELSN